VLGILLRLSYLEPLSQQQCKALSSRCLELLLTLAESSRGLEGTRATEFADEVAGIVAGINARVKQWAKLGPVDRVLQSGKVKEGIHRFHRDIDACMMKYNVWTCHSLSEILFTQSLQISINMELHRGQSLIMAIQERNREELLEMVMTARNTRMSSGERITQPPLVERHDFSLESTQEEAQAQAHAAYIRSIVSERPVSAGDNSPANLNHLSSIFPLRPSTTSSAHSVDSPSTPSLSPSTPSPTHFGPRHSLLQSAVQPPEEAMRRRPADNTRRSTVPQPTSRGLASTPLRRIFQRHSLSDYPLPPTATSSYQPTVSPTVEQASADFSSHVQQSDGVMGQAGISEDLVEMLTKTDTGNSTCNITLTCI
jgi:hypothetical protein